MHLPVQVCDVGLHVEVEQVGCGVLMPGDGAVVAEETLVVRFQVVAAFSQFVCG